MVYFELRWLLTQHPIRFTLLKFKLKVIGFFLVLPLNQLIISKIVIDTIDRFLHYQL